MMKKYLYSSLFIITGFFVAGLWLILKITGYMVQTLRIDVGSYLIFLILILIFSYIIYRVSGHFLERAENAVLKQKITVAINKKRVFRNVMLILVIGAYFFEKLYVNVVINDALRKLVLQEEIIDLVADFKMAYSQRVLCILSYIDFMILHCYCAIKNIISVKNKSNKKTYLKQ